MLVPNSIPATCITSSSSTLPPEQSMAAPCWLPIVCKQSSIDRGEWSIPPLEVPPKLVCSSVPATLRPNTDLFSACQWRELKANSRVRISLNPPNQELTVTLRHSPRSPELPLPSPPSPPMAAAKPAAAAARGGASTPKRSSPPARVWVYLLLLTLQYGAQPLLSKRFVGKEVIVTSSVLACEAAKVICALILLAKEGSLKMSFNQWTLAGSLTASGLPAAIYALQNSLLQISYKNLDSLTFSILNQTKLLFTALFTFLILGQKQSSKQVGALALLVFAAILLTVGEGSNKGSSGSNSDEVLFYGIIPVLVASVLSGLASSLCQWASQVKKHTSYLMTVEMSIVGSLCLLASTYQSPDGEAIKRNGFFYGWTPWTLIPVISNAVGGILVGLVTAHAGGVRKGFVIVSALLVTAVLQFIFDGKPPSVYCLAALPLVISSISIYQKYPYSDSKKKD